MILTDALDQLGVEYRASGHEHCRPGWVQLDCPSCSPVVNYGHFRMGVNKNFLYANCWSCGPINLYGALIWQTGKTFREIKEVLQNVPKSRYEDREEIKGKLELPEGLGPLKAVHKAYLRRRRYDPKHLAKLWHVQGIGLAAKLSWRVFIPIIYRGDIVSWTTRSISDKHSRRYHSAGKAQERINHKTLLYGEDFVRDCVVVCEGPFDVWRIGPGSVCTFGTDYTGAQLGRIAKHQVRAVCFDSEKSAQAKAKELCDLLSMLPGETYNVVLDTKDASDSTEKEIKKLRNKFLGQ